MQDSTQLAQQMLLSYDKRAALLDDPDGGPADCRGWLRARREESSAEQRAELWKAATKDRVSTWGALYTFLDPHLSAIRKEMFRTMTALPGDSGLYRELIQEIVRKWPGSVTRTPSSVVWVLAMAQAVQRAIPTQIHPLAAACGFYYQGVVVFDDIADGELQPIVAAWPRGQIEHLAYSMAGALPIAAVLRLQAPADVKTRILGELAQAIWITNIGQFRDLQAGAPVELSLEDTLSIAQYKTGLGIAKLTRCAGHYLQMAPDVLDQWEQATVAFATARQIASDVCDLWGKRFSTDLATGKCTLPIAYTLTRLTGDDLDAFRDLRRQSQYSATVHGAVLDFLERVDALRYVQSELQRWRDRGQTLLDGLQVDEPARTWLLTWASQADIFADIC
jgi:hypothetical protein